MLSHSRLRGGRHVVKELASSIGQFEDGHPIACTISLSDTYMMISASSLAPDRHTMVRLRLVASQGPREVVRHD